MAERKSFLLRIDPALWSELESWAQAELRSVNGQIEFLLRQAVQHRKRSGAAASAAEDSGPSGGTGSGGAGLGSSDSDVSLL